jgi:TfoX/Sxy family transcriptional regulator of competence genes
LSDRIRETLAEGPHPVEEKRMFGGVCYMVNDKMCLGVVQDEMMCRIGPDHYETALEQPGCREMMFTGKPMKGYVFVAPEALRSKEEFDYWINKCLAFNVLAKSTKARNSKTKAK